jgi:hypothetical protein
VDSTGKKSGFTGKMSGFTGKMSGLAPQEQAQDVDFTYVFRQPASYKQGKNY